jgi:hypothetical protein
MALVEPAKEAHHSREGMLPCPRREVRLLVLEPSQPILERTVVEFVDRAVEEGFQLAALLHTLDLAEMTSCDLSPWRASRRFCSSKRSQRRLTRFSGARVPRKGARASSILRRCSLHSRMAMARRTTTPTALVLRHPIVEIAHWGALVGQCDLPA